MLNCKLLCKGKDIFHNTPLHLIIIAIITFIYYLQSCSNFFYADDLIWLDRVKHLNDNWMSIITPEKIYFTPLTYISFYINYKLSRLDPYWYHIHDVLVHSINGILIYLLAYQITNKKNVALISSVLFVTSPSIIVTVLWPSARTDLLMVFFSLSTIIAFVVTYNKNTRIIPVILYALALCAKGTALVIPLILFLYTSSDKSIKTRIKELSPYIVINLIYLLLLMSVYVNNLSQFVTTQSKLSIMNLVKSLIVLIIPEHYIANYGSAPVIAIFAIILCSIVILYLKSNNVLMRTGILIVLLGLIPLMFARDYVLAGENSNTLQLISSPSNRLYLACAGISLIYGVLLDKISSVKYNHVVKIALMLFLFVVLLSNYRDIKNINERWATGTNIVRSDVYFLNRYAEAITDNTVLMLYNFEGSTGFCNALVRAFYKVNNIEVHRFDRTYKDEFTDVNKSPLNNPLNETEMSNVKLIMRCPGNINTDKLINEGNILLQDILLEYKILNTDVNQTEKDISRSRLNDSMVKLKATLSNCTSSIDQ